MKGINNIFLSLFYLVTLTITSAVPVGLYAQSGNIDYFELSVNHTEDSTQHNIIYLLAISEDAQVSTIDIILKDPEGQTVHSLNSGIATLKANNAWRMENGILYLTIETGAHAPSLYYEAKATLTPMSGDPLEYVRTKQM